ncbi:hypothetical protein LQ757_00215 [Agromyces sp. SYSU K20354]|uniref:hypothetical protein n=1 Tax=Agromyces cavernae TaxID=2898659 RepID=UPI001E31657C|nr:hypothetical protein [Agromyces cavernae]MCD2440692.1 hypothetical protein [Agromyces cavernae]
MLVQVTWSSSGFFDDEDAAATARPEPEEFRAPAWMQAPDDELPVRLLLDRVIARNDAAAVVLREVRAFSVGFEVHLDWVLRRRGEDAWEWRRLAESATAGGWSREPEGGDSSLRFGLGLADGSKVRKAEFGFAMPGGGSPEPPTAMPRHGGSSGGDRSVSGSTGLWVWSPEPLRGELRLVLEWTQVGIPICSVPLDGDAIAGATLGVRPLWDEAE